MHQHDVDWARHGVESSRDRHGSAAGVDEHDRPITHQSTCTVIVTGRGHHQDAAHAGPVKAIDRMRQ